MLNPDWEVIVWRPAQSGKAPGWHTKEHSHYAWTKEDWAERFKEAGDNVREEIADLGDFPRLTEVHRSDLYRWRLLHTMGGFWSDIDIVFFRPMSDLEVDMEADALLCWGEIDELRHWQAIGFLAGKPGAILFKEMERIGLALAKMPHLGYQDLGTNLLVGFARPGATEAVGSVIGQIPQHAVYPFKSVKSQMPALWMDFRKLDVRQSTIGIHWFAAQKFSCAKEANWKGPISIRKEGNVGGVRWAMQMAGLIEPHPTIQEIRYSIVMPYHDRAVLLHNTLVSYHNWYNNRHDWEVIVVQDSKCIFSKQLHDVVRDWQKRGMNIRVVPQYAPDAFGPSLAFNTGVAESGGEYLVLTSPEVVHNEDILGGLDLLFAENPEQYVVCACQSLTKVDRPKKISSLDRLPGKPDRWYQHSIHRPAMYHFCSSLRKDLYMEIGGFDERFSEGFCFDDDDFRDTVKSAGILVNQADGLLTSHQWHPPYSVKGKMERWKKNKALYESKHGPYRHIPEPETGKLPPQRKPLKEAPIATVVCVLKSGGYFTEEYVTRLHNMVERNISLPYRFICLTDKKGLQYTETVELTNGLPGWWSKIELFKPGQFGTPTVVYFDLDTLVLGNIDDLLRLKGGFYALRPWNKSNQNRGQCGSGIMAWENGKYDFLFEKFEKSKIQAYRGDQVYLSACLSDHKKQFIPLQDHIPGIFSYKRECRRKLPNGARIVCFHGRPRVHEVEDSWVKASWR